LKDKNLKIAIAVHGTRGDVEPAIAVALELLHRGNQVEMAVPPNLVRFALDAGLDSVTAYGPDSQKQLESELFKNWWRLRNPIKVFHQARLFTMEGWEEMSEVLFKLGKNADLILCGTTYQEVAANVAEALNIQLAALHYFPLRANNHILPIRLPYFFIKVLWKIAEWGHWKIIQPAYDLQRKNLRLPTSRISPIAKMIKNKIFEIQAYDKVFFPGLEAQWNGQRPLVGNMTLELKTNEDNCIESWINSGSPPLYFGFGSTFENPNQTIKMIINLSQILGERALICTGSLNTEMFSKIDSIRLVKSANFSRVFPLCRAIVHHGGAGTTAASVRSGVPTVILWVGADQPIWATQVKRLGIGTSRRLSRTSTLTLQHDLETVLQPKYIARAREVSTQIKLPNESLNTTVNLLESLSASSHTR
jgi:UDP:flavonoid glycosyltransferase YjiC (YdhE family)